MATDGSYINLVSAFSVYEKQSLSKQEKTKKMRKFQREVILKEPKKQDHLISVKKSNMKMVKHKKSNSSSLSSLPEPKRKKLKEFGKKMIKAHKRSASTKVLGTSVQQTPSVFDDSNASDDPQFDSLSLFKWIIDPIAPENFFNTYWEQRVLHIKRFNETYYQHVLNSTAIDKIIKHNHLNYSRNVDVVCYENGVKEVYNLEGRSTTSALWDYYSNGCSIRILNPQTYSSKVHLLLATLQEYFGAMVGANVYLTPPNSQGFAPHYDDIEAFILQLEGRKHWKLYKPKDSDVLARYSSSNLEYKDIGEPFMELTLNAGEMLYFPRGTIHEGHTDEYSHSLHITVSVYQQTSYADLLQHILPNALKRAADSDVKFRKGLPLNYQKFSGRTTYNETSKEKDIFKAKVESLLHSLMKYVDIDLAVDLMGRKFMYDSMPPVLSKNEVKRSSADGPYLNNGCIVNKVEIDWHTRIRLVRYYCLRLVNERNSNPKLYYNTENGTVYHGEEEQWLELEPEMIPSICMLQKAYPLYTEVDKLPMEDESLKMQLISALWEHGLIVADQPLKACENE
ncbi:ribosomal oxygenase 1 [Zophobas morio]|uniref:ribosomal oxygenase 1 n=1 Tax=Zophobas morio TaxID=2755281 RepID=UPI00308277B3